MNHPLPSQRLTLRGWIAIWTISIALATTFTILTHDKCWNGTGYSSCQKMLDQVVAK